MAKIKAWNRPLSLLKPFQTYALCFGKPICRRICSGDKCCLEIFVGVGFFLGGSVAIVTNMCTEKNHNL